MNLAWTSSPLAWLTRIFSLAFIALNTFAWFAESSARQDPNLSGEISGDFFFQWAIFTHLLPLLLLVAATIAGWLRPFYGFLGFALFALLQLISVGTEWIYLPLVVLPPALIAAMYLAGWLLARRSSNDNQAPN